MRNFTHRWERLNNKQGAFYAKLWHAFPISKKKAGETSPLSPSNFAPGAQTHYWTPDDFLVEFWN